MTQDNFSEPVFSAGSAGPLPDPHTMELLTKNFSRREEDKLTKEEILVSNP